MGLKENIDAVKKELDAEEQFLESVIKAESFFKRYKKILIAVGTALVIAAVSYSGWNYMKEQALQLSNEAYNLVKQNPDNKEALATLKAKNPSLYELYLFSKTIHAKEAEALKSLPSEIKDKILQDLAHYQKAAVEANAEALGAYAQNQEALLKELALLDEAYLLFEKGEGEKARKVLAMISLTSPLYQIAQNFSHYQK